MATDVNIKYVNNSMDPDKPTIFVFTKNQVPTFKAAVGKKYEVEEDDDNITIKETGPASKPTAFEIDSRIKVRGVRERIGRDRDGTPLIEKDVVANDQKAASTQPPKISWGTAQDISEGEALSSAALNSGGFWVQDIEGVNEAVVTLEGNPKEGYTFNVKNID